MDAQARTVADPTGIVSFGTSSIETGRARAQSAFADGARACNRSALWLPFARAPNPALPSVLPDPAFVVAGPIILGVRRHVLLLDPLEVAQVKRI